MSGSTVVNTFNYNFDAASQLTSASATGTQMTYTFDNLGRVLTASNSGTTNIPTTVYDANSRRTQQTATVASVADYKNTWTWDNANRQTQVKQEGQTGGISVAAKRVDFTYNTGGLFTGITRYNDLAGTQIVANTTYTYDQLARLTALDHKNASGGNLANYTWTFDNDGRITNFTNIDGFSNYTYDTNDQVTVVDHSYQTDETYTYDANGNRTNTGYTTSTNNQVTSDGTYNYTYDNEGNRTSRTKISDSTKVEYTWDHRNRLTDIVFKTSGGTVTKKVQYQYDVFDRRIGKKIDADGNGTYESATYWVYDDAGKRDPNTGTSLDDIVLEFNDADGDGSGLATLTTRYLHGPQFDHVLASEASSGNVVTWALADHQGTVRDMVRYASGTTTVVNHRKYDAFGNLTAESDATVKFLYSYTGREWDGDAGLYYYRARWYDAKIGRFISEDPMGFAAGDTNISRYVGNSAVNGTDPTGLDRGLTANERQALEYIYRAAMEGFARDEELRVMLAETLAEVRLIDYEETFNPIALIALTAGGAGACTQGEYQYYRDVPTADDIHRLALIGHETMHSFHEELTADGTFIFDIVYLADSVGTGLSEGDFYMKTISETFAYAMGTTINEMLNDAVFRNAVQTGTTGQLPEEYRRTILLKYNAAMTAGLQATPMPPEGPKSSTPPLIIGGGGPF